MGDINIDSHDCKSIGYKELTNFMTTFSLKNLIKDKTCFSKDHESSIDLILTNKSESFLKSYAFELGLSDCHKMINATLRAHIPRIKTKFRLQSYFIRFLKNIFGSQNNTSFNSFIFKLR